MNPCTCLYCGRETARTALPAHQVVCSGCALLPRNEAREIAAGMGPWARPLRASVGLTRSTPAPDPLYHAAKDAWDQRQREIAEFNAAHAGGSR